MKTMLLIAGCMGTAAFAGIPSNIHPSYKECWSENIGWMNWRDAGSTNEGVLVAPDFLTGYVWAENLGWIDVGDGNGPYANGSNLNYGLNILPSGDLEGLGWCENTGWINFGWAASTANPDRARFDSAVARFRGWAWGENTGWVNLDHASQFLATMDAPPRAVETVPANPTGSHMDKNRFISFVVPSEGAGLDTAIRVELSSLHHPAGPPNAPNFSMFEGQYRYLNAIRDASNNPVFVCPDSAALGSSYNCAKLGCTPEYRDWAGIFGGSAVHVMGDSVVPSSQYGVSQLADSCAGNEASCAAASAELTVSTERWGNVDNAPVGGTPNAIDIGFIVSKVKDAPGSFIESRCQLQGPTPNPYGLAVNALDIGRGVDAVKGLPYPFTISACP